MTSEQQARDVEGFLSGNKQCAYCKHWQSADLMKAYTINTTQYICKETLLCTSRLWDDVRADRERASRTG